MSSSKVLAWIKDESKPELRSWEEFYRNRWQHDKSVRSTHGVNCTGGCSWQIYVKDGIVTWEMQALDYPLLESTLLSFEEIVERCGYSDASSFRKLFKRATSLTPADYRDRFRLRPQ